jgi:hypothetical protein
MKVLSIKQPWCSLIGLGIKPIENRTWKTNHRGTLLLHASASFDNVTRDLNWCAPFTVPQFNIVDEYIGSTKTVQDFKRELPTSAIIGEVQLIDCVQDHDSIWAESWDEMQLEWFRINNQKVKPIWNWVLENPVLYDEPIKNVKGKLNLWEY